VKVSARADEDRVVVSFALVHYRTYLNALVQLDRAQEAFDRELFTAAQPRLYELRDQLDDAKARVASLFTENLRLDEAERLYGHLGGSIVQAKANRGDFARLDREEDL
jgi:regulator of replication initiation timing